MAHYGAAAAPTTIIDVELTSRIIQMICAEVDCSSLNLKDIRILKKFQLRKLIKLLELMPPIFSGIDSAPLTIRWNPIDDKDFRSGSLEEDVATSKLIQWYYRPLELLQEATQIAASLNARLADEAEKIATLEQSKATASYDASAEEFKQHPNFIRKLIQYTLLNFLEQHQDHPLISGLDPNELTSRKENFKQALGITAVQNESILCAIAVVNAPFNPGAVPVISHFVDYYEKLLAEFCRTFSNLSKISSADQKQKWALANALHIWHRILSHPITKLDRTDVLSRPVPFGHDLTHSPLALSFQPLFNLDLQGDLASNGVLYNSLYRSYDNTKPFISEVLKTTKKYRGFLGIGGANADTLSNAIDADRKYSNIFRLLIELALATILATLHRQANPAPFALDVYSRLDLLIAQLNIALNQQLGTAQSTQSKINRSLEALFTPSRAAPRQSEQVTQDLCQKYLNGTYIPAQAPRAGATAEPPRRTESSRVKKEDEIFFMGTTAYKLAMNGTPIPVEPNPTHSLAPLQPAASYSFGMAATAPTHTSSPYTSYTYGRAATARDRTPSPPSGAYGYGGGAAAAEEDKYYSNCPTCGGTKNSPQYDDTHGSCRGGTMCRDQFHN